jgi:DNA ligase D-like protein (predicted 3'-phosphoesterase)
MAIKTTQKKKSSQKTHKLTVYQKKRHFDTTPEPRGSIGKSQKPIFVVHYHEAHSTHYDLRLEIDSVLSSWAIPKGPSSDPAQKHLAVPTEDHPLEYAHFEGVIPEGQYGAGPVMIWDRGTYRNLKTMSMEACLKRGCIEVWFEGEKLKGGYALIRTKRPSGQSFWLFLKMHDECAHKSFGYVEKSVVSGRTIKQIEEAG